MSMHISPKLGKELASWFRAAEHSRGFRVVRHEWGWSISEVVFAEDGTPMTWEIMSPTASTVAGLPAVLGRMWDAGNVDADRLGRMRAALEFPALDAVTGDEVPGT